MNLHTLNAIGRSLFHEDAATLQRRAAHRAVTRLRVESLRPDALPYQIARLEGGLAVLRAVLAAEKGRE
jgi:hypothetical protein